MDNFFDEYGFMIISAVCGTLLFLAFNAGLGHDGFIGKTVIEFAKSIIGG